MYDVVIIGSGLGGLLSAAILSKNGKKVLVLEKNRQFGGCLQNFSFNKKIFDSCVHYIGGLGEGHTLYKILDYLGIIAHLPLQQLDENGFDRILLDPAQNVYPIASGYENFVEQLLPFFPKCKNDLQQYIKLIKQVVNAFPLFNLRNGFAEEKSVVNSWELNKVINNITKDEQLRKVLLGNNFLYAGTKDQTPFYLHALVMDSYLHSSHKIIPSSAALVHQLIALIKSNGGELKNHCEIINMVESNGKIIAVENQNGDQFFGNHFISNIHPLNLISITASKQFRPAFRKRIKAMTQTDSCLMLNIVLKEKSLQHRNYNIYWHPQNKIFSSLNHLATTHAYFFAESKENKGFSDTVSILKYENYAKFQQWEQSFNISGKAGQRGQDYEDYKTELASAILSQSYQILPELKDNIVAFKLATPLSFRDYTGTPTGALYGVKKELKTTAQTQLSTRTKIENLYFTGQNVNLHGVLGVSITALATCADFLGLDFLLKKINNT